MKGDEGRFVNDAARQMSGLFSACLISKKYFS